MFEKRRVSKDKADDSGSPERSRTETKSQFKSAPRNEKKYNDRSRDSPDAYSDKIDVSNHKQRRGRETPQHKIELRNERILDSFDSVNNKVLAGIDDQLNQSGENDYKDEAIQLLSVKVDKNSTDAKERFVLNQEAMQVLKDVPGPIGVVSVCGLKGTGKSFLLNLILHKFQGTGFKVNKQTDGGLSAQRGRQ